jgi:hypothetical protein
MHAAMSLIIEQVNLTAQHEAQVELIFAFAANDLVGIKTAHPERRLKFVGVQKSLALLVGEALEDRMLVEPLPDGG